MFLSHRMFHLMCLCVASSWLTASLLELYRRCCHILSIWLQRWDCILTQQKTVCDSPCLVLFLFCILLIEKYFKLFVWEGLADPKLKRGKAAVCKANGKQCLSEKYWDHKEDEDNWTSFDMELSQAGNTGEVKWKFGQNTREKHNY